MTLSLRSDAFGGVNPNSAEPPRPPPFLVADSVRSLPLRRDWSVMIICPYFLRMIGPLTANCFVRLCCYDHRQSYEYQYTNAPILRSDSTLR
eukprot:7316698-Pyramimonas_sp.AAC.1